MKQQEKDEWLCVIRLSWMESDIEKIAKMSRGLGFQDCMGEVFVLLEAHGLGFDDRLEISESLHASLKKYRGGLNNDN